VRQAVVKALTLATDHLGPLPGGRMAAFRAPGSAPRVVEEVHPSRSQLERMAASSGAAVGHAARFGVDPGRELAAVVSGHKT
jgi:hypothetical protein